jgi:D-inositol-3-phosphate glycosyltransferase
MKNRIASSPAEMETGARLIGEQTLVEQADQLVAATMAEESQLEFLYQANPNKIRVIPPGVDLKRFAPIAPAVAKALLGIPESENLLLFVGRIEPLKGIRTLIQAVALIHHDGILKQYPHYLAVIGGDPNISEAQENSEMARLQALCRELDLGELVLFLGKRSQDTLPLYYSAASVLVMPSHYESFGMVALEAMACGTPVVASQVGGLAFLVQNGQTGFVVPDGDPLALAEKLTRIITQPELRERLGQQAAAYARSYDWEIIADQMLDLYQDALSARGQPR